MDTREVDVVVLGGGPVGENVAQYATEASGLSAVLVEAELVGGECSYYACMPSKAMLRPLHVAAMAGHLGGLTRPEVDVAGIFARRDEWVSHYDDSGQADWARTAGIEVVRGGGRIIGERLVEVDGVGFRARHAVVIATGGEPAIPEVFAHALPWGSRDATGIVEVPDRLAIVGGGVVACEAATWLAGLGSEVTMLVRGDRLLANQEPFASDLVLEALRGRGVSVRLGTEARTVDRPDARATGLGRVHGGPVTLTTGDGTLVVDELLVATGRRPRLRDLGLDAVGLDPERVLAGDLPDWLWCIGDASGEAPLTHWGKYRARIVGDAIASRALGRDPEPPFADPPVPQVVFTDPQVARVGLTEAEAQRAGRPVDVAKVPFTAASGGALLRDDATGAAHLVVDPGSGVVVGATFVGPDAGELLHAATIAIVAKVPVHVLRHAVPSYPTASELWLRLLEQLRRKYRRDTSTTSSG